MSPTSKEALAVAFEALWSQLFLSSVHLDSALSKQTNKKMKSVLAQIVPQILLKPGSLAEALGVGINEGEPWSISRADLAKWRPAVLIAERLYSQMNQGTPKVAAAPFDFPDSYVQAWEKAWGSPRTRELIQILSSDAPLSLRANRKIGAKDLLRELNVKSALPVRSELSGFAPMGVRLAGYAPVLNTSLYESGAFEIQDEGSQIMALFALWPEKYGGLLQKEPGPVANHVVTAMPETVPAWTVIDACAGAGGKSLAMADALKGRGRVFAYDTVAGKLQALRRRAKNAGLNSIKTLALPKEEEEEKIEEQLKEFEKSAHVVLVDAPCSGWGVLRRNPDTKWRQSPDVLERMPKIQKRLLSLYSKLVAPGGHLVFGVCTFRPEETREVVEAFTQEHPEFHPGEGGYLGPSPCDGFFMQAFYRR